MYAKMKMQDITHDAAQNDRARKINLTSKDRTYRMDTTTAL
jgi:hypothetical protein